ncbi:MAG: DUF4974 domain-containing protein [Odoribacteraceae bacterium]|nr:DUF4974 domain-containing protein [Odoribacteraceae bacterium]
MNIAEDILEMMLDTLAGEANEEQHRRLQGWIDAADAHRAEWVQLCRLWYGSARRDAPEEAWKRILERHSRRVKWRVARRVAVASCVALLVAPFLLHDDARDVDLATWLEQRKPGRAELVLPDGRHVALDRPAERWEERVYIANDSTGIHYRDSDDANENAAALHELIIPRGGEYRVTLADGTVAELNSGTTLRFPARFGGETREVWLAGEAYFHVSSSSGRPFIVHANRVTVEVSGTEFNVSAYPDDATTSVTLATGSVEVRAGNRAERLSPGYRVEVDNATLDARREKVDLAEIIAWREGVLRFEDATLEELMKRLERWYDVPFDFRGEELRRARFSGGFRRYDPLPRVLGALGEVNDVIFRVDNDTIIISNK